MPTRYKGRSRTPADTCATAWRVRGKGVAITMQAAYVSSMRTTINLDDGLLAEAKRRAAEHGTTLTGLIEDALRETLARRDESDDEPFATIAYRGRGLMPGVDLDDGAALRELLDGGGAWSSPTSTS